jgi:hypothetical protein
MFIAALFIIVKLWKQPRCCPITGGLIIYILYIMRYYLAIRKYEIMLFAGKWMKLKNYLFRGSKPGLKDQRSHFSLLCES